MLLDKILWKDNGGYNHYIGYQGNTTAYFYDKFMFIGFIVKCP
jgi:hypothetical protein